MNRRVSLGITITLIIAAVVLSAAVAVFICLRTFNKMIADLPGREAAYDYLTEADNIIRGNYYGDVSADIAGSGQVRGYLSELPQGTNYYMDADEYSDYKRMLSGKDANGGTVASVTYQTYASCGYVKFSAFLNDTAKEFKNAVNALKGQNVTALVIDLRGVKSINTDSAAAVIDEIVPIASAGSGVIASAVNKDGETVATFSSDADSVSLPMCVIINGSTGGAAELVACDIRDFGKGTIVGETSMGSGGYQQIFELSDGGAMALTTGVIIPYDSEPYDGSGVKPDTEVKGNGAGGELSKDEQFLKAYAAVNS